MAFGKGGAIKAGNIKNDPAYLHNGVVTETMSTPKYTYVLVKGEKETLWAAGPKAKVKKGDKVEFIKGLAMKQFHSKQLKRDFSKIYFTNFLLVNGVPAQVSGRDKTKVKKVTMNNIKKEDYSISEVYKKSEELKNKQVKIRGRVVKFSKDIMGMNWLHIQDGTGKDETSDLVVTTKDLAKVGDKVLISAKVITKKDFGQGYYYKVLLQEAKIKIE